MKADDQDFQSASDEELKRPESDPDSVYSKVLRELSGECLDELDGADIPTQIFDNIQKAGFDDREYRGVILSNGLRVMLISDPSTDLSAASLSVACGSYLDPPELPGLAHYVEHMVFVSNKKYPSLGNHAFFTNYGDMHSTTDSMETKFNFIVDSVYLKRALDRLAHSFISPTFDAKYMEKELEAIEHEFDDKQIKEGIEIEQVNQETCDQTHGFAKFPTGNKKTLKEDPEAKGIDVRTRLLEFYSQHYSANLMCLCVLGKDNLDKLYTMVVEQLPFSQIENKKIKIPMRQNDLSIFRKEHLQRLLARYYPKDSLTSFLTQLQKEIKIVPINGQTNQLLIEFHPLELLEKLGTEDRMYTWDAGMDYVLRLFESNHSRFLAELKKRKISVEILHTYGRQIHLNLPAKDSMRTKKINGIMDVVFQFLKFIKRDGIRKWVNEEQNAFSKMAASIEKAQMPLSIVETVSSKMQWFKLEHAVDCELLAREFRPELIEQLIDHLTPENMRITLISKEFEGQTDREEKYYGIRYSYEHITQERVRRWTNVNFNENFKLHLPNRYLPTKLELVEREREKHQVPQLIKQDHLSNVWFLQDNKTPRAFYGIYFKNEQFLSDSAAEIQLGLFCLMILKKLNFGEDSEITRAGIGLSIFRHLNGLVVEVCGYSEQLPIILGRIMNILVEFKPSPKHFEELKMEIPHLGKQSLENVTLGYINYLLTNKNSVEYQINCMNLMTLEQLESVPRRFFSQMFFNLFLHGNVTRADAELVENLVIKSLIDVYGTTPLPRASFIVDRGLKLDDHTEYIYYRNRKDSDNYSAILTIFQIGLTTATEIAKVAWLVEILKDDFCPLGILNERSYSSLVDVLTIDGVQSIIFFIRSRVSVEYMDWFFQKFILWAADYLNNFVDEEEFDDQFGRKKACVKEHFKVDLSTRFWSCITDETLDFERDEQVLKALEDIGREDVISFFNEHLIKNPRKLSVHINGRLSAAKREADKARAKQLETLNEGKSVEVPKITKKIIKNASELHQLEKYPNPREWSPMAADQ